MKKLYAVTSKVGFKELLIGCLFAGIVLGTIIANTCSSYFYDELFLFDDSLTTTIANSDMDCFVVAEMAFVDYIKEFGLLVLLCTTIFGTPYIILHCTYKGFCIGFIVSIAAMRYGVKGLLFFLCYISPQCLIYIPVLALTYLKGYEYCSTYYGKPEPNKTLYKCYLKNLFFLVILIGIMSLLEGYINTSLLRMIMLKLVS